MARKLLNIPNSNFKVLLRVQSPLIPPVHQAAQSEIRQLRTKILHLWESNELLFKAG